MLDPFRLAAGVVGGLHRALVAVDPFRSRPVGVEDELDVAATTAGERFRWESDMLDPVASEVRTLAPWLEGPAALIAEVPAAIGVVDLLGVRFDRRSLRNRIEAEIEPVLSPLRVRVLCALLDGPRHVDELAASVASNRDALLRSTLRPLEAAELVELEGDVVRSTGMWLPAATRVIAIELKLTKWRDALNQADNFTRSADEAWVVLDSARAATARRESAEFSERGVGLAALTATGGLDVLLRPARTRPDGWLQALIAERALAAAEAGERPAPQRRMPTPGPRTEPRALAKIA